MPAQDPRLLSPEEFERFVRETLDQEGARLEEYKSAHLETIPADDGSYTFVLSRRDPGVHNWIDPCGMSEGILTLRMAEFPEGRPNDDLSAKSRVVPLSSLRAELPAETKWVSAAERSAQLAERSTAYVRRLPEA